MAAGTGLMAGLTGVIVLGASPALAASAPRIAPGTWQVKMKVVSAQNADPVGKSWVRPWKFTPKCATGGCATTLQRHRNTAQTYTTYVLSPKQVKGTWQYSGSTSSITDCFSNHNGGILVHNGYTATEAITVIPTNVRNGTASSFHGTFTATFTPTAAGKAKGCAAGHELDSVQSVSAP